MGPSGAGRNSTRRGVLVALFVIAVIGLAAYFTQGFGLLAPPKVADSNTPPLTRQGEKIVVPETSPLRSRLVVAPPKNESVAAKLVLPGIVEADPARTATVLTPLGGRLVALKVSLGDRVAKGQVVAVLDSPDLAQALDDDEKARDTRDLTEKNLTRQQEQVKIGAASAKDLDQAKSEHAQADAEYRRTQARLAVIGLTGANRPGDRLLQVKAPVEGSVTALSVAPGNMINDPTQPLMTIADLSTVWVTALVPEKDVAAVAKDQAAEIVLAAYPADTLHGSVLFVSDVIEPDSRRNKLRIAFPNPDHRLKPNMFATVTLAGPPRTQLVLPTSALLMNNDRISVFVATAPWTFERRTIQARLQEGDTVPIDSGLSPGDQVVVKGGILLND
jgi:cobalt-zinc-cadmium efflux system membrane fusion protein